MSVHQDRITAGIAEAQRREGIAKDEYTHAREVWGQLSRFTNLLPEIQRLNGDPPKWAVNIPPFHPDHFDGDSILAPFGGVYFDTLREASEFMAETLNAIERGEL